MLDMAEIEKRLEFHEGLRLQPYFCTRGKQTIGVGRCLDTNPLTVQERRVCGDWHHGISRQAAFYLLRNDIKRCVKELKSGIPFFEALDDERQYALIDMCFQLGIRGLLIFRRMIAALGVGNYKEAARQCLDSAYAKQTPARAARIAKCIEAGRFEIR
ncbi:MAG: glycoside hydrolase family protein [Alphaproteobacteria bacterium]|nr:glycoside hydrolase family protein [Alphaproteobacteria bacterium]MBQ9236227.1 glycoside hydrolase family protein [Alphaproteobacteria bacterium]